MLKLQNISHKPDSVVAYTLYGNSCYCAGGTCICSTRCNASSALRDSAASSMDVGAAQLRASETA